MMISLFLKGTSAALGYTVVMGDLVQQNVSVFGRLMFPECKCFISCTWVGMEYVKVTREMGVKVVGRTSGGDDRRVKTSRIIRRALLFLNRLPIFVRCWFTLSSCVVLPGGLRNVCALSSLITLWGLGLRGIIRTLEIWHFEGVICVELEPLSPHPWIPLRTAAKQS